VLLEAREISFGYEADRLCFKGLSMDLQERETIAVLGLNGQGKSTLLLNLMGVLKPLAGSVTRGASYANLPQIFHLAFEYSVLDVVLMGRAGGISIFSAPSREDYDIAREALSLLEISHLSGRKFNALSGGQKQLVLFARALAAKAQILFLDEPASALDLANQDRVMSLIYRLNHEFNLSVVFTTHNPNHAFCVAARTLILYPDLSYDFGATDAVLTEAAQQRLYGIEIHNIDINAAKSSVAIYAAQRGAK